MKRESYLENYLRMGVMKIKANMNKGFSLVELIVVVLIMAIVAVALAPQVMKWVENSRLSKDIDTRNTLREQCEIALADNAAFNCVKDKNYTITMTKTGGTDPTFVYTEDGSTPITPDPDSDAYWGNLLKVTGVNDFDDFQDKFTIKSNPGDDSIVLSVVVYRGGHTIASITGISGNNDIEID